MFLSKSIQNLAETLDRTSNRQIYLALYAISLALVLCTIAVFHLRSVPEALEADEFEYWLLSTDLLNGSFDITPRRTIGFPALLAGIRLIFDNFIFLQFAVGAIYALSGPAMFKLMKSLQVDNLPAVVASLCVVAWPASLFYGTSIYSETAGMPVFLFALALLPSPWVVQSRRGRTLLLAFLSGLTMALAAHIRPMFLLFVPFVLPIVLIEDGLRRVAWSKLIMFLLGFAVLVLPWSVMMHSRFHQVIILSANGGETLGGGLNPKLLEPAGQTIMSVPDRDIWIGPGKWLPHDETGYVTKEEKESLPYLELDRRISERAMDWIKNHPVEVAQLEMYKLAYMWGIYPISKNPPMQIVFGNIPLLILLGLSLYLFLRQPQSRRRFFRLWVLAIYVSGVALISWGSWRFRQVGDAGLLAYCVACGWSLYVAALARKVGVADQPLVSQGGHPNSDHPESHPPCQKPAS